MATKCRGGAGFGDRIAQGRTNGFGLARTGDAEHDDGSREADRIRAGETVVIAEVFDTGSGLNFRKGPSRNAALIKKLPEPKAPEPSKPGELSPSTSPAISPAPSPAKAPLTPQS